MLKEPKYLNAHLYPSSILKQEKERIVEVKKAINFILDKGKIEFKTAFKYEMPRLREGINQDIFKLSDAFLHCIAEIRTMQTQEAKVLAELFSDLDCLNELIDRYNEVLQFKKYSDPYYKNKIFTLTVPYIPEMKKLVLMAQKMFAEEETALTLNSAGSNLFEDEKPTT